MRLLAHVVALEPLLFQKVHLWFREHLFVHLGVANVPPVLGYNWNEWGSLTQHAVLQAPPVENANGVSVGGLVVAVHPNAAELLVQNQVEVLLLKQEGLELGRRLYSGKVDKSLVVQLNVPQASRNIPNHQLVVEVVNSLTGVFRPKQLHECDVVLIAFVILSQYYLHHILSIA